MTTHKVFPSGAWQVSAIANGHLITRTYYGFTKREALFPNYYARYLQELERSVRGEFARKTFKRRAQV